MLIILLNTRRTHHNVAEPEGLLRVPQAAAIRPMSDHAFSRAKIIENPQNELYPNTNPVWQDLPWKFSDERQCANSIRPCHGRGASISALPPSLQVPLGGPLKNITVNSRYSHRINNQPDVRLRVGAFDVGVLAHVASRISSSPSIRHLASYPGSFYRRFFLHIGPYKYKTSAKRQPSQPANVD